MSLRSAGDSNALNSFQSLESEAHQREMQKVCIDGRTTVDPFDIIE